MAEENNKNILPMVGELMKSFGTMMANSGRDGNEKPREDFCGGFMVSSVDMMKTVMAGHENLMSETFEKLKRENESMAVVIDYQMKTMNNNLVDSAREGRKQMVEMFLLTGVDAYDEAIIAATEEGHEEIANIIRQKKEEMAILKERKEQGEREEQEQEQGEREEQEQEQGEREEQGESESRNSPEPREDDDSE